MKVLDDPSATFGTADAAATEWAAGWLATLDAPAGLWGALALALVILIAALGLGEARPPRDAEGRPQRPSTRPGRRGLVVVVLDLDTFTEEELARLVRLRRRYRTRDSGGHRAESGLPPR